MSTGTTIASKIFFTSDFLHKDPIWICGLWLHSAFYATRRDMILDHSSEPRLTADRGGGNEGPNGAIVEIAVDQGSDHSTATTTTQVIHSLHTDYILAVALDVYGRRMATVSGDRLVRVWDLQNDGTWASTYSWQAHKSAVTAVSWAHAEFGNLLATAGTDQDVKIWEELSTSAPLPSGGGGGSTSHATAVRVKWNLKAALTDARRGLTCAEFAPRQWGLKLATGSLDGYVRIYEAVDIMNLSQWPVAATLQAFTSDTGCSSISWCTGRFDPPTLVAGGSHVVIYRYSDTARAWQSVLQIPAVSTEVLDVAWAPNVGRRYHSIAVANEDLLRIFKLSRESPVTILSQQEISVSAWRCQWNVTGTVLASSGDAGTVQLYKCGPGGDYAVVSKIQGDLSKMAAAVATAASNQAMES
jgi:nucleoporin SEH1